MTAELGGESRTPGELDLAVVGHINLDHMVEVRDLPAVDRTVPVLRRRTELGGTATNVARAAAAEGVRTALVSRVGPDFPPSFLERLRAEGIDLEGIESCAAGSSSACIIVHDRHGGQVTLIDQGPMADTGSATIPQAVLLRTPWVHLGTGDPRYLERIQRWALAHGVRVAADPAQEIHYRWNAPALRRLLSGSEIFFGNEAEVRRATALLRLSGPRDLTSLVPLVVVTRGARGAEAFDRTGRARVGARNVGRVSNPTGAGDAFRGGFYASFFHGERLDRCLSGGVRSAATWLARRPVALAGGLA